MPLISSDFRALALVTLTLVFAFVLPVNAAVINQPVPGGVAVIPLGVTAPSPPKTTFGDRPVWVRRDGAEWQAVVGLPLDLPTGPQTISVDLGTGTRTITFTVAPKRYPAQHIRLKDDSKVSLSETDEARALKEIDEIQALKRHWRATEPGDETDTRFLRPVTGRIASRFGLQRFFNGEPRAPHSGLDVAVPRGTPINAAAHGKVLATGNYFFNGNTVFIDHGNGLITMYCHLDRIDVQSGEQVAQGQRVGAAGSTGRSSGPHLHWSVVLNGTMVDPELFLAAKQKTKR